MATKSKTGGMHTAGIFSDMTVDGPEIGTLVVIVDRAKNLPSRKAIGKQDPYCACRLGKEAKKTETDRRGGQTPRWDQELRFTVHDSADYYQLKVSVFNDDKKTDLIGETWINLQDVVIPGGGVSDIWHSLSCKGKYAGEIRIEITYYDTRPKQEKAVEKVKQSSTISIEEGATESLKGPRQPQPKAAVKRRPLPSDPITGAPPPAPVAAPIAAPIPALEQPVPRGYSQAVPIPGPEQVQPRGYPQPAPIPAPESLPRGYSQPQTFIPEHVQAPVRGYSAPTAIPAHVQTPPRGYQSPSYISNQSPLQSVEYNTQQSQYYEPEEKYSQEPKYNQPESKYSQPEPDYSQHSSYEDNPAQNGYGGMPRAVTPIPSAHPDDRYGYDSQRNDYDDQNGMKRYGDEEDHNSYQFDRHSAYELPQSDEYSSPPSPEGPPPPPPVHRSRHGSAQPSPAPHMPAHGSFDSRQQRPHYGVPSQDGHRHSMPDYQSQTYQPYRSPTREEHSPTSPHEDFQESPPRHSYDSRYEHHDYNSMQPTVEDAPPSPSGRDYSASPAYRGGSRDPYEDRRYEKVPSPAPLNLNGRGSVNSGHNSVSTTPSHQYSNSSMNYGSQISQLSYRDRANTDTTLSSRTSYNQQPQAQLPRRMSENPAPMDYNNMPPVPPSLVAGMDPAIAQEISDRIYDEKRANFRNSGNARGYQNSPQYQSKPHPLSFQEPANPQYGSTSNSPYDDRQGRFSTASTAIVKPRAISPDPRRSIMRKSVSPAPYDDRQSRFSTSTAMVHTRGVSPDPRRPIRKSVSPSPGPPLGESDTRRLSGIPFGPDSYNAFNPTIASSTSATSLSAKYDIKEIDPDAKIITHDGREIDPSDHIPETNWAPLRETKAPKYASQLPDRNYRPPPVTTATAPASGRRPLRVAARPQSMAASSPVFHSGDPSTPPRNRLQKKSNRISAQPAPYSSPSVPTTSYQDNYTPRGQTRDYGNENYAPQYGRGSTAPPIPAKVPMQITASPHTPGTSDPWALLEEMKNIDLGMGGTGRARRRQY